MKLLAVFLPLWLGGCTYLDTLFEGEPVEGQRSVAEIDPETEDFPNLASVPDQPPRPSPQVERDQATEGLVSDRGQARFSDQPLEPRRSAAPSGRVPSRSPPPPPADPPDLSAPAQSIVPAVPRPEPGTGLQAAQVVDAGERELLGVVDFDGADRLDAQGLEVLQAVAASHRTRGGDLLVVGRGADGDTAGASLDRSLLALDGSVQRADLVAEQLVALGVAPAQLQVEANASAEGQGARRVEIYLVE